MAKTRSKARKRVREKGIPNVNKFIQEFKTGQRVHITVDSSVHNGRPHRRFWGKTGVIKGKQGDCYYVEVSDIEAKKKVLVHPVHLTAQK